MSTPEPTLELSRRIRESAAPVALWVGFDRFASDACERTAPEVAWLEAEVRRVVERGVPARADPPSGAAHTLLPIRDPSGRWFDVQVTRLGGPAARPPPPGPRRSPAPARDRRMRA